MSDDKKPSHIAATPLAILALLGTLITYGLSIGPAVWLRDHQYITTEQLKVAYWPIRWLCRQHEWINHLVHWYVALFP